MHPFLSSHKKMSFCEALHGRRPRPALELNGRHPWGAHWRWEGRGRRGRWHDLGVAWGVGQNLFVYKKVIRLIINK
jgi:hypothetical protein